MHVCTLYHIIWCRSALKRSSVRNRALLIFISAIVLIVAVIVFIVSSLLNATCTSYLTCDGVSSNCGLLRSTEELLFGCHFWSSILVLGENQTWAGLTVACSVHCLNHWDTAVNAFLMSYRNITDITRFSLAAYTLLCFLVSSWRSLATVIV